MPLYEDQLAARNVARDLISTALQSGAIKLLGPDNALQAASRGERDAEYLTSLLRTLTTKLSTDAQ